MTSRSYREGVNDFCDACIKALRYKCEDEGKRSKIIQNCVTSLMDDPYLRSVDFFSVDCVKI